MRISLNIIFDELHECNPTIHAQSSADEMLYSGVYFLTEGETPPEEHLLIIRKGYGGEIPENSQCIIFFGEPKMIFSENISYLTLDENLSELTVANKIQKAFLKYRLWEESLQKIISREGSIQELCEESNHIFENPLIIYDNNLLVLALSNEMPGLPDWDFDQISGKELFLWKSLTTLNWTLIPRYNEHSRHPSLCRHILGCRGLYNNLWINNNYAEGPVYTNSAGN
jgi:hypothetical protein